MIGGWLPFRPTTPGLIVAIAILSVLGVMGYVSVRYPRNERIELR